MYDLSLVSMAAMQSEFAYEYARSPKINYSTIDNFYLFRQKNISGFIRLVKVKKRSYILVSFAGTNSVWDWWHNLRFNQTKSGIHVGWYRAYRSIKSQIDGILKKFKPNLPILVTGHSMGACLACIFGLFYGRKRKVYLITFGSPKFANQRTCDRLRETIEPWNFVHYWDLIPRLPLGKNFARTGKIKKLFWCGNPHGMVGYLQAVKQLWRSNIN